MSIPSLEACKQEGREQCKSLWAYLSSPPHPSHTADCGGCVFCFLPLCLRVIQ